MDLLGGKVEAANKKEYGKADLQINKASKLFRDIENNSTVWMSHGDKVTQIADKFHSIAKTDNSPNAAVEHEEKPLFGIQFHPEVEHTPIGREILKNFCFYICECKGDWSTGSFIEESINQIREKVGNKKIICGLSGGVDSSVVAVLLDRAIGKNLECIFVDTGMLRYKEAERVEKIFTKYFHINYLHVKSDPGSVGITKSNSPGGDRDCTFIN